MASRCRVIGRGGLGSGGFGERQGLPRVEAAMRDLDGRPQPTQASLPKGGNNRRYGNAISITNGNSQPPMGPNSISLMSATLHSSPNRRR